MEYKDKIPGLREVVKQKRTLRYLFSYVVDFVAFLPRLFYRAHMKDSIKEKQVEAMRAPVGRSGCTHEFNHLEVVKLLKNAKCKLCGMKLKDAEKDVYGDPAKTQ